MSEWIMCGCASEEDAGEIKVRHREKRSDVAIPDYAGSLCRQGIAMLRLQ